MSTPKSKKPTLYTFGEILEGILIVGFGIFIFQTVAEFYIHYNNSYQNPYNSHCCCNLELIDELFDASDNYGTLSFHHNSFCIRYNSTKESTSIFWPTQGHPHRDHIDQVQKITNQFRKQLEMNYDEFNRYLYLRNIPFWTANIPCYHMLNRFNLKERNMKYGCIDINIES